MRYLRGTKELPLILSADSTNIVKWWVDGSYGIHPDARIQTGGNTSLGKGYFMSTSIKQRLNTRISTETELVAAGDLMPRLCWTNYFLEFQGYNFHSTIMYQYNQSAILLENNRRASSSKRTKHINIRYFLSPTESKRVTFVLSIVPPTIRSRVFYQTSSRQEISSVQKIDYESTGLKYTLTKGVCWESTSFILYNCPMFGFQSDLLPFLFQIHEWII